MTTDGVSGGSKPQTAGGLIPLAGVVLAALPTQASRRMRLQMQAQKTHRFDGGGYRCLGSFEAPRNRVCYRAWAVSTAARKECKELKNRVRNNSSDLVRYLITSGPLSGSEPGTVLQPHPVFAFTFLIRSAFLNFPSANLHWKRRDLLIKSPEFLRILIQVVNL